VSPVPSAKPAPGVPPVVYLKGISKYFPGVIANQDIDLEVKSGEIHALLGENGAGKSTLMNILTGIYQPDAGEIIIDGYRKDFASPVEAIAAGIGMVHQHFKLVNAFTVAENVHLGWSETPWRIDARTLEERTAKLAASFNLAVQPDARISDISIGEQQRVEILRVLSRKARLLILDEPTAVLTPAEARQLFIAMRGFVAQGNAVIFISHKLDEVLEISDRVTILRGGRKVASEETFSCNKTMLAKLMVGHEILLRDMRGRPRDAVRAAAKTVLTLDKVSALNDFGRGALKTVSLQIRAGEILGIAGVAGNGQKELTEVLTGLRPITVGRILAGNNDFSSASAARFAAWGVGHIPEDRIRSGLAATLSVTDNAILREYNKPPISGNALFWPKAATTVAHAIADSASVQVPDFSMPVRNLSGGNQQRLVARREIRIASKVLVAAYPSRGLDVGAINTMMRYLAEIRDAGAAIVLVSEELDELFNLSDRIAVMFQGEIMGILDRDKADMETVGLMMGGQKAATREAEVLEGVP
jgi:general nucleoside transport system ATP-binding protein